MNFSTVIRRSDPSDSLNISKVRIDTWRATYNGLMPESYLDELNYQTDAQGIQKALLSPSLGIFVADSPDKGVVGFVGGGKNRNIDLTPSFDAELYAIHILPQFQKRGLGQQLWIAFTQWLVQNQFQSMMLWVLEENESACKFYECLGGSFLNTSKLSQFGESQLKEIAYGWPDLKSF